MKGIGAVFDCMVFVQAVASRGPAYRCFERVTAIKAPLWMSKDTFAELQHVLNRSDLRRKLPGLTEERVQALLHHLGHLANHVDPVPRTLPFPPDPKDEPYINLAIEARAEVLLTRDIAILALRQIERASCRERV